MAAAMLMAESESFASAQGGFGLADVPPMGWSTKYAMSCKDLSADRIKAQVDLLVSSGLKDLGFKYVIIDDCWQARARNELGLLDADLNKFPNGFKEVADYIHEQGLLVGITSDAGVMTCNGNPGSLGFEAEDVELWSGWDIDYVKYGNCNNKGVPALQRYQDMATEIAKVERPMFYAISNYGNEGVTEWAPAFAQSWRTTLDVQHGE